MPRGLRNNNPLNIRRSKSKWLGEVDSLNGKRDTAFCQFSSLTYGYRACAKLLQTYQIKYKLYVLDKIIGRWAPPKENNTRAYADRVAKQMTKELGEPISVASLLDICKDKATLRALIVSMHLVECGQLPTAHEREAINQALTML
ncbi:MAG: structural protein P5 [Porphyromonas sp.]|uniref:structural protein P5 n=1 Tax=Porphyromonas sp. TaxID=1924944 RepID=UPI002A839000|nr:structural protein P5 [Porphyromonas sp.]MDY4245768.1 structural protein P5 [Porphyromonas sp.]